MDIKERLKNLSPEQRAQLLKRLSEERAGKDQPGISLPEIEKNEAERFDPFPLNNLQQAYLIGRSGAFEMGNIPSAAYVELESENLDLEKFKLAWKKLIERHEILRSVVHNNYTQQILKETPEFNIAVNDLTGLNKDEKSLKLKSIKREMLQTVKNTEDWPLFEVQVSKLNNKNEHIHFKLDLLNFDAGSIAILFNELKELYINPDAKLPELDLSYRDYLIAEKKFEQTDLYERSKRYWLDRLSTIPPVPELPLIKNPDDIDKPFFSRRILSLKKEKWQKLKALAANKGLTPTVLLLTAYAEVLGLWSSTLRFSINIPLFNRFPLHPDVNKIMGDFSTVEILEVDRTEKESFVNRAKKIHQQLIADLDNRYFDGVAVFRELAKINSEDFRKGVPVIFTSLLDHGFTESISKIGKIVDSVNQTAHVWCDLHVDEVDENLVVKFDAVDELFEASVLDDMLSSYINLLKTLAENEENWEDNSLNFFPPEQAKTREHINNTKEEFPDELLNTLFEKKANEQPDRPAVIATNKQLTFKELYEFSNRIGRKLRKLGAEPDKLIAIIMEKGWEQIPAVYGILQSGAAYLPIDPDFPEERIKQLLADGEVNIVLTQSWIKDRINFDENTKCFAVDGDDFTDEDNSLLEHLQNPNNLAYVLYTSGSTGKPKGVMIEHRSVVNRMLDVNKRYGIKDTDRAIGLTALQHDLSVYDIFGMLIAGGAVVIPDSRDRMDPAHWAAIINKYNVTFWNSVPAFLDMFIDYLETNKSNDIIPDKLRMVVLSGDWIPVSLPDRLRALIPGIQIIGSGGPTETTIWDIFNFIGDVDPAWKSIPYGKPMANAKYYVMKENFEECPDYVIGELCIAGTGLARGFWKDKEKTNEKFVTHPLTGERLYRSGDLGCYLPDGNVMIAGRKDFQVKIRGLRVELGEIESILKNNPEVKDSIVTAAGESQTNKRLIGYIVPARKIDEPEIKPGEKTDAAQKDDEKEDRDGSLLSDVEKMELKLKHLEIRQDDDDKQIVPLQKTEVNDELKEKYLARQTYRKFLNNSKKIPFKEFSEFLSCLAQLNLDELPFPKYRYPSAGSLYPVQTYLYIKPNAVEDLEGGTYYYNPKDHKLVLLAENAPIKKSIHTINNYQIFEDSAFSIFLVAQMKAIAPVYGTKAISERVGKSTLKTLVSGAQTMMFRMKQNQSAADASRDFCLLEAGYMGQLLMTSAQEHLIGLAPTGGVDFERIRKYFDLEDTHMYIHGFVGGPIDKNQTKKFSFLEELPAAGSQKDPRQEFINEIKNDLQTKLPEYMIPANFVLIDELPLTPNGKVNRKALPVPEDGVATDFKEMQTGEVSPSAEKIAEIVAGVLKLENINPFANLFNLGATSIQIIMMTNQFENKLGYRPRIDEIYADPTIAAIAEKYDKAKGLDSKTNESDEKEKDKTLELLEKVKSLSEEEIKQQLN